MQDNRNRWSCYDDICLLKGVVAENPFNDPEKWKLVQKSVELATQKTYSVRACRDHLNHLLKKFVTEDRANLRKSGTEEEYSTKEQLLQHVKDLKLEWEEERKRQEKKKTSEKGSREAAVVARYQAAYSIQCSENVDVVLDEEFDASSVLETSGPDILQSSDCASPVRVPPSTADAPAGVLMPTPGPSSQLDTPHLLRSAGGQKRKANLAFEFIKKKQTNENTLKLKELELKEKQIELERKKLELEEQKERNKEEQFKKQIELQERRLAFEEQERRERLIRDKENEKNLCNMVQMTFEMMKQMTEMINKK